MMNRDERLIELEAQVRARWYVAMSTALHGAGCSCCGGSAVRLDGSALTEGIVHALRLRYAAGNDPALAAAVACHFEDAPDPMTGLRAVAELDVGRAVRIARDILASLDSIGGGDGAASFVQRATP